MGQDMCVMTLCHRNGVTPDLAKALAYIDSMTTLDMKDVNFEYDYGWDELETDGRSDGEILADVQDILRGAIGDVFDSLGGRDNTWIQIAGWQIWITGGMDGGTDSFETWNRMWNDLGTLGWKVLNAAGFENPPGDAEPFKIEEEASLSD
jgi:hypothetical protein